MSSLQRLGQGKPRIGIIVSQCPKHSRLLEYRFTRIHCEESVRGAIMRKYAAILVFLLSLAGPAAAWEFKTMTAGEAKLCYIFEHIRNGDAEGLLMVQAFTREGVLTQNINIQLKNSPAVAVFPNETAYGIMFDFPGATAVSVNATTDKDPKQTSFLVVPPDPQVLELMKSESSLTLTLPSLDQFKVSLSGSSKALFQWSACTAALVTESSEPAKLAAIPTISDAWSMVVIPDFDGCAVGALQEGRGIVIQSTVNAGKLSTQLDAVYGLDPETVKRFSNGVSAQIEVYGPDNTYDVRMQPRDSQYAVLSAHDLPQELLTHLAMAELVLILVPNFPVLRVDLNNADRAMGTWNGCNEKLLPQPNDKVTDVKPSDSSPGNGPSFDCTRPLSSAESMICRDEELAQMDRALQPIYEAAKARAEGWGLAGERTALWWFEGNARTDLALRESSCKDRECIVRWYLLRFATLSWIAESEIAFGDEGIDDIEMLDNGDVWISYKMAAHKGNVLWTDGGRFDPLPDGEINFLVQEPLIYKVTGQKAYFAIGGAFWFDTIRDSQHRIISIPPVETNPVCMPKEEFILRSTFTAEDLAMVPEEEICIST